MLNMHYTCIIRTVYVTYIALLKKNYQMAL